MPDPIGRGIQIKREFATRRARQTWITAAYALPIVALAILKRNQPGPVEALMSVPIRTWLIGCLAYFALLVVFSFHNWRCPACEGPLSRTFNHGVCRRCGAELQ